MRDRILWGGLVLLTLLRLGVAATVPLSPDEAYYWVWSHALAPGYLDHPPMVALWIAAGTAVLGQTALGVRAAGPLACLGASWLLLDAGRRLFPRTRAGPVAVVLLNASLVLGVGSVIITPDTPLLVFWTATLWASVRIAAGGNAVWWLVSGVCAGLALDSKYTAAFLWVGLGAWVVLTPSMRVWLRRWQPYAGGVIGVLLFVPVLAWNAERGWAGILKQGGRVGDWQPARAIGFLGELIGGQLGLATPVIFGLCMIGLVTAVRRGWAGDARFSLLAAFSLPPVLVFLQHALGDRVQGNWPAIIYPALALAAGAIAAPRRWIVAAAAIGFGVTALAYGQAVFRLLPLPPRMDPIALRLVGWDGVAASVRAAGPGAFVAVQGYGPASEMAWWLPGSASGEPVVGADMSNEALRWRLTRLAFRPFGGQSGLLLRDARQTAAPDPALWSSVVPIGTITRPGAPGPSFALFRVTAAAGVWLPVLPSR